MNKERRTTSLLDFLELMPAGRATITVGGRPFISINSDKKTLEVEADGVKEAGLRLSDFVKLQGDSMSLLEGSGHVIGELSSLGWKLTLYAEGNRILAVGSGVSRLTGRISVNPLRLKRLLEVLR